jgi:hypothetical protein
VPSYGEGRRKLWKLFNHPNYVQEFDLGQVEGGRGDEPALQEKDTAWTLLPGGLLLGCIGDDND